MKHVSVLYGKGTIVFSIPDENLLRVVESRNILASDARKIIISALQNPIGSPSLKELTKDIRNILIISPDNTRPMPSRISIPAIISEFYRDDSDYCVTILISTGLHRKMTYDEIKERFSDELMKKHRIINHVATDEQSLVCLGKMSTSNELWVNRLVTESELVIGEGFIEPHFFAGFSGGRKCILPGVCGAKTIMSNHCPENIGSPYAASGNLEKNPIHDECVEGAKMSGLRFILNVALNRNKEVIAAFAGDPVEAHLAGCEFVRKNMTVPVNLADIVITSNNGYPLDRNIYQSVKGLETASKAVKKDGVIILASECSDRNGNNEFEGLISNCATRQELFDKMSTGEPEPDKWQAQIFARIVRDHPVILISDYFDRTASEKMFMLHASSPEKALEMAFYLKGADAKINVLPEGPVIIPVLN